MSHEVPVTGSMQAASGCPVWDGPRRNYIGSKDHEDGFRGTQESPEIACKIVCTFIFFSGKRKHSTHQLFKGA